MTTELHQYILSLADDALILGHRNSEWAGHAPILEEDIAFANLALDEIGHARVFYGLVAELKGENPATYPDALVYRRPLDEWNNAPLYELPKGDWAVTVLRQFLYDSLETIRLGKLAASTHVPLAEATHKINIEKIYHLRHSREWARRLGLGTETSNSKMQDALNQLWPHFEICLKPVSPHETSLVSEGRCPSSEDVAKEWHDTYAPFLREIDLKVPGGTIIDFNRTHHTEYLSELLEELQEVVRQHPDASW